MPTFRFTARKMPPVPSSGQVDYWDKGLPGFGMRISPGGTRTWVVMYRYNGMKRRLKLGTHPGTALADARDAAREALRKAEKGRDPATEREAIHSKAETVADLARLYLEQYAKIEKSSWFKDNQILNAEVLPRIGRKKVNDVTRQDVRDILQPIIDRGAKTKANHTLEVVRKMFNWNISHRDWPGPNPAALFPKPSKGTSRSRYLSSPELKAFWAALHSQRLDHLGRAAFKLMTLTLQREMEVVRMRWSDLDLDDDQVWTIPADHAKNRLEHVIPLTPVALDVLRSLRKGRAKGALYVFPSPIREGKHLTRNFVEDRMLKIREQLSIGHFTPHDLRRTGTTYLGKLKVPKDIKKKILNHEKRRKTDVTDIYDRFEYIDEKRDALTKWEELLLTMVTPKSGGNVVKIEKARASG